MMQPEERPQPRDYGLTEHQAEVLKQVFLDRPMRERARAIAFVNDSDPRLQRRESGDSPPAEASGVPNGTPAKGLREQHGD
jgi:hypothetical protein